MLFVGRNNVANLHDDRSGPGTNIMMPEAGRCTSYGPDSGCEEGAVLAAGTSRVFGSADLVSISRRPLYRVHPTITAPQTMAMASSILSLIGL